MRSYRGAGPAVGMVTMLMILGGGVAQAAEPTKILPEPTAANPITGIGKASKMLFQTTGGATIQCTAATGTGEFTDPNNGKGEAHVTGCKTLGLNCTSEGNKAGEITLKDQIHYWLGLAPGKKLIAVAVALITTPLVFVCGGSITIEKRGCTAGEVPSSLLNKKITSLTGTLKQSKGKQEITEILPPESKTPIKCVSEISMNGGKFEEVGQEGEGTTEKFEQGGTLIEIELMN